MPTAIIIVILIVVLSIGLFSLIKKLANATNTEPEIYPEEGAITDFNAINQKSQQIIDEDIIKKSSTRAKIAIIISQLYAILNKQIANLKQIQVKYQQRKAKKIKQKEQAIQDAIRLDQESQDLEAKHQDKLENDNIDTSYFEIETTTIVSEKPILETKTQDSASSEVEVNPETKATDFVEQLLSEVDTISGAATDEDISDTYYYEYMEKRYIDRIVANSRDIEAYKKLGDLYVDMRNYKDALEAFEYVLKLKPNDTIASRRVKDISHRLQKQG